MLTLSLAEKAVLGAGLALSIWLFWRRFGVVVQAIRESAPDAGFSLQPLAPRIGRFVFEVLLQGLVIRERLWPGIAHALVFWGFCAFALVSIDHLLAGFGIDLLPHDAGWSRAYLIAVGVFAALVAVSISGLAVRRFLVRPRWLGEVAPESGAVAGLILVLMLTYLATFVWAESEPAGRVNWWLHTAALLVFLPLIPHTKHLHLVLSPATVLLERSRFSDIPPLAGDEDFGLVTGRDVTRLVTLQAYSCVECGRCSEHCPAFNTGKVLDPKKIALGFRDYLNAHGPQSEEPLLERHLSMEAAFQCTTCGACEFQCPVGVQHLPMIVGLRRGAVNTGAWEDEHGTRLFLNLERYGNPLGMPSSEREKFIAKNDLPLFDGTQEYCLWLGCMGAYDPRGRETVVALARVLRHLGITFGVLARESCSGDAARRLGNDLLFETLVETNRDQMREAGVRKLVSACPHCVRTIGTDWAQHGAAFEIEHHSELLARHREHLPTAAGAGERVVFHDPCYLGRYRNIYEEPRQVAAAAGPVVDPPRSRSRSFCCGAGGGLAFLGEEKGKRVSVERAEELAATGAPVVATACPFCATMFRDALGSVGGSPPRLLDIAQLVAGKLDAAGSDRPSA